MVKMTTPYSSPYCVLSSCKILGKNNELFFQQAKKTEKRAKKGVTNVDFRLFSTFFNFWSIFVNFEQQKKLKIKTKLF